MERVGDPRDFVLAGRWRVSPRLNRVFDGEVQHQVPDKFMQVLVVLAERRDVVSREELFEVVWPETVVVDESLTRAISGLRRLFEDSPQNPRIIETIPKKGYRLIAEVDLGDAARPSGFEGGEAPRGPVARYGWALGLGALGLLALLVGAGVWWAATARSPNESPEPSRTHLTSLPGIEEYPTLSPSGDRLAFVWDGNDVEPDGVFVQVVGAGNPVRLTRTAGHYAFPAWTHDARFIAFARIRGEPLGLFMVPATGGPEVELVAGREGGLLTAPAFSPDGRWLAFCRQDPAGAGWRLERMDLETGALETLAPSAATGHGGFRPRFSPDGRHLAFIPADGDRQRILITTAQGEPVTTVQTGVQPFADFDWAPTGEALVISGGGHLRLVGLDGTIVRELSISRSVGALSVAAAGSRIVYSGGRRERNIWRWSPSVGQVDEEGGSSSRIIHSTAWDSSPAVSPDGRTLAFLSDRTGVPAVWVAHRDGSEPRMIVPLEGARTTPPAWAPQGDRVALTVDAEGTPATALVEIKTGRVRVLPPFDGGETRPSWSRDGTALLVVRGAPEGGEIWRRGIGEGAPEDATVVVVDGGYRAVEAPDGESIFFTRTRRGREIWRSGPNGESPETVVSLDSGEILTWRLSGGGLVVGTREAIDDRTYRIRFFDLAEGTATDLLTIPGRLGFELDVDPIDGRTLFYDQTESIDSDVFAVDGF